jgi:hypothetical protein
VRDDRHFVFLQKLLGKDGSMRRGVVMVKQPGLFLPKFWATSSYVFTQSPQNIAVEPGIHSLVCWDRCFALPQLLCRWQHQSGIFWIPPRKNRRQLLRKDARVSSRLDWVKRRHPICEALTFRNPASYIKDGYTATFNTPHFFNFFNKYTY